MTHDDVAMFYNHLSITLYLLVTFERASYFLYIQNTNQIICNFVITRTQFQSSLGVIDSSAYSNIYVISEEKKTQTVWYNGEVMLLCWQMPRYILVPEKLNSNNIF